ncbi:MAG: permease [Rhodothermaceae bacterium]|nr:permease [Rhodothermaceae bacterium]MBC14463.1 permease [Rhodothermaceae bacterium]
MPLSLSDLRAAARLASGAVVGVTDVVEATHAAIARPFGRPKRTRGITGFVYRMIRAVTRRVALLLDGGLSVAGAASPAPEVTTAARDAAVAALNGVVGDALAAEGNPLAIRAQVRLGDRALALTPDALARGVTDPSDVLLVHVHGLCMNDRQWGDAAHDPRETLASALGATALTVRYNSGRHVAETGRDIADLLDPLVANWPRPVRRLVLVGHSMGGLVLRSALHLGAKAGHAWPGADVSLVCLGTPHHGAPLERIGSVTDGLLEASRYAAPLARVGQIRSAGVTDLRYGSVAEADWRDRDRFERGPDDRQPIPLPDVPVYLVAATTGDGRGGVRDQSLGDGLVPLDSALGRHADPARDLGVPPERTAVFPRMHHFALLRDPAVTARLVGWLAPG